MAYDYQSAVLEDVREWCGESEDFENIVKECTDENGEVDRDEVKEKLYDILWTEDSVTGNGSGSYTFNREEAGNNLIGNFDLLSEVFEEFGGAEELIKKGEEACDVSIRCYLLGGAIDEVVDELLELGNE